MKLKVRITRSGMMNTIRRLVRWGFPAPWWALLIFGSCIVCIATQNWLAAAWAFTAGAWCQAYYDDKANEQVRRDSSAPERTP